MPECGQHINALTGNKLLHVFDTIAVEDSALICANALSSTGNGFYVNLMGIDSPRKDVKSIFFLGYTLAGEAFEFEGTTWPAVPEDFELGKKFFTLTETLLGKGLIKPHPTSVREGGLGGVLDGMQQLKDGKVSGMKLVYRVDQDTM